MCLLACLATANCRLADLLSDACGHAVADIVAKSCNNSEATLASPVTVACQLNI